MAVEAQIIVHNHVIHPTGRQYRTYEWVGERHGLVKVTWGFMDIAKNELPWKLHKVGDEPAWGVSIYIRKDAFFPFGWWIVFTQWLQRQYWPFFNKFMATLNIWGLAYTPMGCIPSWRDIGKKQS